jgi:hypothetical protein
LGTYHSSLTDRMKRRLGLSKDLRKLLTPYEQERRSGARALGQVTAIFKSIRLRIPAALKRGNEMLIQGGYAPLAEQSSSEKGSTPQHERLFSSSGPPRGLAGYLRYPSPFPSPVMSSASVPTGFGGPIDTSPSRLTMRSGI